MKRLVILTVGKTHSGKSTFAKQLEDQLANSFVMDQDNHAAFLNEHYEKLVPVSGLNTLKHRLSETIATYAKTQTDLHFIVCNANLHRRDRQFLLNEMYPANEFIRIIVYFDIDSTILQERIKNSDRNTYILRKHCTNFQEVLMKQENDSNVEPPTCEEADYLFQLTNCNETQTIIEKIIRIAKNALS